MKIAFVVSFFDFRNDVRRVITEAARQHEVVLLGRPEHEDAIRRHLPSGVEFRCIQEKNTGVWNALWERLYLLFRRLPRSRSNFFLMELFKASNQPNATAKAKAMTLLRWSQKLPKFISYDFYLRRLRYQAGTQLNDIERFICFTALADDYLLARLLNEKKSVRVYVYSWDHPCKHTCFSQRATYACWSEGIREDVISLQKISQKQVKVTGASQFGYIHEYLHLPKLTQRALPFRYIYFGCAIGISELVPHELRLIELLSKVLLRVQPNWMLLIRPYPVLANWELYEALRKLPNVVFDDAFRMQDASVQEDNIQKKYTTIQQAEAFFHLGTTMGLEACFTETPSFIIDFGYTSKEGLSLYNFIHQYQNDRHLIQEAPQNAIRSEAHLAEVLQAPDDPSYRELNKTIQQKYALQSFAGFTENLIEGL